MDNYIREYSWLSKAWHGEANLKYSNFTDEVLIMINDENNMLIGEFAVRWYNLDNNKPDVAKLEVFDDSFEALYIVRNLIEELSYWNKRYIQPKDFVNLLNGLGFKDVTPYENPYE